MKLPLNMGLASSNDDVLNSVPSCMSSASFWKPHHIVQSAWLEHGPFAFWLVDALRPRTIVELGTHNGFSYFSFCQAVQRIGLTTACYAVDTWQGDEHAGFYGNEIYQQVSAINERDYSGFSTLLRCRFDEALPNFADGTIDLLHIDGRHTYDDVRTDFESWRPKLSPSAIVLFHDTNVRERNFGVWRFWDELTGQHPSFEFVHGHGLGILAVGENIPLRLQPLFDLSREQQDEIRAIYASIGHAVNKQHILDVVQADAAKLRSDYETAAAERAKNQRLLEDALSENAALRAAQQVARAETEALHHEVIKQTSVSNTALDRIQQLEQSISWRASAPMRSILGRLPQSVKLTLRRGAKALWWAATPHRMPKRIEFMRQRRRQLNSDAGGTNALQSIQTPSPEAIARELFAEQQSEVSPDAAATAISSFAHQPLISIVMPVYKTPIQWLRRAVESLQEQYYTHWELCVVDDCSPSTDQKELLQRMAATDPRIKVRRMEQNGGISAASNAALAMAGGEYIALLDHDDEITPDALFRVVEAINAQPDVDFIYSDECKIDDTPDQRLFDFILKPDWSPEIMFNGMITGHFTVYRKVLIEKVGGFRSEYDFSQDYDLALRASEAAKHIFHIERVLYLWRSIPGSAASGGKDFARESNIAALNDALRRRGIPGQASPLPHANLVRITEPSSKAKVSIIIPSDSHKNLEKVLKSVRNGTDHDNYEVIVVCNGPLAEQLSNDFAGWTAVRFVKYDKQYNFSDKCNEGARAASGDIVIFYNDDVFPVERDWIERLIEYLWVPGVGGISPKLLHENDTIQYAGMISGTPGLCGTAYNNIPNGARDAFLTMHNYVRNVSILSGACCAFRKDVFWEIGGFDAINTPDGHSDMDLSYKLIEAGYRCVYTPYSLLRHIGNHSWGAKKSKYKADIFALRRWGKYVSTDPYFTDSMKRVLYDDFRFNFKIFADTNSESAKQSDSDVLLISHELTLTGAPRMLFYAAQALKLAGYFPVIVAPADGPLRDEIMMAGITVIIDESIRQNHFLFERFARNFDLAIVNTVDLIDVLRQLSKIDILRTVWWLHEAQILLERQLLMQGVSWERVQTLCVSHYAEQFVPHTIPSTVIHNGVPDLGDHDIVPPPSNTLTFIVAGTIEHRKGQDILIEAISLMPIEIRRKCRFVFTGKLWEMNNGFWEEAKERAMNMPELVYLGLLSHKDVLSLISTSDVIVCPSRDDPFPLVVVEAAMLSKPSIVSDHVGVREVFDEASCFVFESENAKALAAQLVAAYERRESLSTMGRAARVVYDRDLSMKVFSERFTAFVLKQVEEGNLETRH